MAVGPWYRDQLDISLTERIIKGVKQNIWTQGPCFSFAKNNIIYDTPIAHTASYWREEYHNDNRLSCRRKYRIIRLDPHKLRQKN